MNWREADRLSDTLKERMDSGDRANADRIDQLIIDRSEDRESFRDLRKENREAHDQVMAIIAPIPGAIQSINMTLQGINDWIAGHNKHHGPGDSAIGGRLGLDGRVEALEGQKHDGETRADERRRWVKNGKRWAGYATSGTVVAVVGAVARYFGLI